jgi:hypothetical protein
MYSKGGEADDKYSDKHISLLKIILSLDSYNS